MHNRHPGFADTRSQALLMHCPAGWAFLVHHCCVVVFFTIFYITSSLGTVRQVSRIPDIIREQDRISCNTVSGDIIADVLLHVFDRWILPESAHHVRQGDSDPCSHCSPLLLICQQYSHINKHILHLVHMDSYYNCSS